MSGPPGLLLAFYGDDFTPNPKFAIPLGWPRYALEMDKHCLSTSFDRQQIG
jgi:hypothetical protein